MSETAFDLVRVSLAILLSSRSTQTLQYKKDGQEPKSMT
jgi:hypothetical protein